LPVLAVHPKVQQRLADHPRWVFHFTPTSASWLNGSKASQSSPAGEPDRLLMRRFLGSDTRPG
jgi:hypothetical protein